MSKNFSDYNNLTSLFTGIKNKNVDIEKNIAPVEDDASSSSKAYAVNSRLILGDKLYKVIAAIDVGDALIVDTNIELSSDLVTLIGQGGGGATYTAGNGIDIDANNVISSDAVIFTGTTTQWNNLSIAEKCEYTHACFTDDNQNGVIDATPTQNSINAVQSGGVYDAIQVIKPTYLSATLSAGSTSVTFTDLPTEGDYAVDFFASDGSAYESIDASVEGQVTVNYAVSGSSRTIKCRLERI